MRAQLLLIPPALFAAVPAQAEIYLTFEQAQQRLFPNATFTPVSHKLTDPEIKAIIDETAATVWSRDVKAWQVSTGGWLLLDQVVGRDDWISYAVAIDENRRVAGVEVLECLERWNQVLAPEWRGQFKGRKRGEINLAGVTMISGTTLSSIHIAEGIKRLLVTFALVIDPIVIDPKKD